MDNSQNSNKQKVAFHTLGCKLNFAETSTIARTFAEKGYEKVKFDEKADVYIINTCSVTEVADKKCRQVIKKASRTSPNAIIAVVGCYSQLKPQEIAKIEGVDIVLGSNDKFRIFDFIDRFRANKSTIINCSEISTDKKFFSSYSSGDRTRSFLKVQDGCDYKCSFCTIPLARGKSRNDTISNIVHEAEQIGLNGYKEVIITGVNIGDFGQSTGESFFNLIKELEKVDGIERFRISSIEPNLLTNEIIEFVAGSKKFLPHFHIPLQSGSDTVLKKMRRRYLSHVFAERILKIKSILPDCFIGVDVIIGFPGESEQEFEATYKLLANLDVSFLHIFPYSERANTASASFPGKVSSEEITSRSKILHSLSDQKHKVFYERNIGKIRQVLFEHKKIKGDMLGFTENYIKVEHPYMPEIVNHIKTVELKSIATSGNMVCRLI